MTGPSSAHEPLPEHEKIEGSSDRGFGFVFAGLFAILAALALWRGGTWWPWAAAAAALVVVSLAVPGILAPLNRAWTGFALLLYRVVSPITMGVVFFVIVTPIGWFMRARGKDLLRLRRDPAAASYWIARTPPGPPPESMRNQY